MGATGHAEQASALVGRMIPGSVVSVDEIEGSTNLDFFPEFSSARQRNLEEERGTYENWFAD